MNVVNVYLKCQVCILNLKLDIDVQKIKVKKWVFISILCFFRCLTCKDREQFRLFF